MPDHISKISKLANTLNDIFYILSYTFFKILILFNLCLFLSQNFFNTYLSQRALLYTIIKIKIITTIITSEPDSLLPGPRATPSWLSWLLWLFLGKGRQYRSVAGRSWGVASPFSFLWVVFCGHQTFWQLVITRAMREQHRDKRVPQSWVLLGFNIFMRTGAPGRKKTAKIAIDCECWWWTGEADEIFNWLRLVWLLSKTPGRTFYFTTELHFDMTFSWMTETKCCLAIF